MAVEWTKLSESVGSGTADPSTGAAATAPVPSPVIGNKPAPGQTGPKGLAPRTSYSRVNTGAPPAPDAGAAGQKAVQPRGLEFLPKLAHKENLMSTTMMQRPNLHELVKEAMEGTASKVDISAEAERQLANVGEGQVKTASSQAGDASVPTEYALKLAGALDYMLKRAEEGTTSIQPGKGPNTLDVLDVAASGPPIDVNQGQAKTQIPMTPPMESSGVAKDPSNAMATNDEMSHPEQPVDPMMNEGTKAAHVLYQQNRAALGLQKQAGWKGGGSSLLARNFTALGLYKQAEDAINSASVSAGKTETGATPPEGASASEEQVPSEPSDVNSQKAMIASNQAAIDYTKRQAKADPKKDVGHVVDEPAMSASTDTTLNQAFEHTQQAGAKIASNMMRTAAAQALLSKLAENAKVEAKSKKEKNSMGLSTPAGQSGFQAGSTGPGGM